MVETAKILLNLGLICPFSTNMEKTSAEWFSANFVCPAGTTKVQDFHSHFVHLHCQIFHLNFFIFIFILISFQFILNL